MPRPESWVRRNLPTAMRALDRVRAGFVSEVYRSAFAFAGAQANRLTADWVMAPTASADAEIRGDLRTLRARSREMGRNDPYAARFLSLLETNVIGPHGIRMQSRARRPDGEQDEVVNRTIETAWTEWGKAENASIDGRLCWRAIQALAVRTFAQDGECLIRMVPTTANPFGFALQMLDCDQLDIDYNVPGRKGQNEIRMGVEIGRWGRPVAYHIWQCHPADYQRGRGFSRATSDRVRIPAKNIIHLLVARRVGQTRGVPWLSPVLMPARMLHGLRMAELTSSRLAATKGGFFEQDIDEIVVPDPLTAAGRKKTFTTTAEPAKFDTLPPGLKFVQWDPQHPNTAFGPFSSDILHSMAVGVSVSHASLTGDLTKVSFSSIRKGTIEERDSWECVQGLVIEMLHSRVRTEWMRWALTTGALRLPTRDPADYTAHEWMPRGWDWVDPLKDMLAAEKAIELGITSRTRLAARRGVDFEEVIADQVRERRIMEAAGLDTDDGTSRSLLMALVTGGEDEDGEGQAAGVA